MRTLVAAALILVLGGFTSAPAADNKITLVAAENFYGGVAVEIGGDQVSVTSILSNPDQDPHLFETSPTIVRKIAMAQIVVYNGVGYDPWMTNALSVTPNPARVVLVVANLMHKSAGDNPHLWYDPATMPAVARALAAALSEADPVHQEGYAKRLNAFLASLEPLNEKVAAIGNKYAGVPVTATEPVFGDMAAALKLKMRNERFQLSIMNDTEPRARDLAAFEQDLALHRVRVMFYNKQASNEIVQHLVAYARASNIPVVGVTETAPPGLSYRDWMLSELAETEKALAQSSS